MTDNVAKPAQEEPVAESSGVVAEPEIATTAVKEAEAVDKSVTKGDVPAAEPTTGDEKVAAEAPEVVVPTNENATSSDKASALAASAPAETSTVDVPAQPEYKTALSQLWETAKTIDHDEIWGVKLADPTTHVPSQIVFQKYLNANDGDIPKAKEQLVKTLEWRAQMKPLNLLTKTYSREKFDALGYVNTYARADAASTDPEMKEVFTWNIYGATKSIDTTFGDLDEFIQWRVALMELALKQLNLANATIPISSETDPYKITQVHDYKSISFFRQSPVVKKASTETIKVFAQNYPELLKEKYFLNVPAVMGFMYAIIKVFVSAKTAKKFHPMANGQNLAGEFGGSKVSGLGEMLPVEYGGKGESLQVQAKGVDLA